MQVEKKIEIIIPDGYEELKNPDISSLRDDDMMTWAAKQKWYTIEYCRNTYVDFHKNHEGLFDDPIYIRKKIVLPTTPGSFYIFENKLSGDKISWFLGHKGWYAINVNGVVYRVGDTKNILINNWIKNTDYKIALSHDAGNPLKKQVDKLIFHCQL